MKQTTRETVVITLSNMDVERMFNLPEGGKIVRVVFDAYEPAETLTVVVERDL